MFDTYWSVYDFVGAGAAVILFSLYISSMIRDLRHLAKQDPPKPFKKNR